MNADAPTGLPARVAAIIATVQKWRPVRVFTRFSEQRGGILAAGLAYQGLFATFAGIWVAFSIAGLFLRSNSVLTTELFAQINTALPGLIDIGDGKGAVSRSDLFEAGILSFTGAIALVGLLITTINWFGSGRDAVRAMFTEGPPRGNVIVLKLKDLALATAFGFALLLSAALSVASTAALEAIFDWLGADRDSMPAIIVARGVGLVLVFALDAIVLASFYRVVAGVAIPVRRLVGGSLVGAAALGVLKAVGSSLIGGATSNPLLASFAVIVGLLIWFNLVCQVILLGASWIAVRMSDDRPAIQDVAPSR